MITINGDFHWERITTGKHAGYVRQLAPGTVEHLFTPQEWADLVAAMGPWPPTEDGGGTERKSKPAPKATEGGATL